MVGLNTVGFGVVVVGLLGGGVCVEVGGCWGGLHRRGRRRFRQRAPLIVHPFGLEPVIFLTVITGKSSVSHDGYPFISVL